MLLVTWAAGGGGGRRGRGMEVRSPSWSGHDIYNISYKAIKCTPFYGVYVTNMVRSTRSRSILSGHGLVVFFGMKAAVKGVGRC